LRYAPEGYTRFCQASSGESNRFAFSLRPFPPGVYGFAQKEPVELGGVGPFDITRAAGVTIKAGRAFHWYYESAMLKVIFPLDLPGALLVFLMSLPFALVFYGASVQAQSWITALISLIGTSIQWWLVGYCLRCLWNQG
jgi:hypothetical protein